MDDVMRFMVYCAELYRQRSGLSGPEVMDLFEGYDVLRYIEECCGALHVTGIEYICDDLDSLTDNFRNR